MIGRTLGHGAGFIFMGLYAMAGMLGATALALGAATYLEPIWPRAGPIPVALGIVGIGTACAVLNIRLNARVTGCFLVVEVLALGVLTGLGAGHIRRPVLELIRSPLMLDGSMLRPATIGAVALATSIGVFVYSGFGMAVYFSEEMHEAPRRIAKAIFLALAVTVVLEFAPLTAVLLGAPDVGRLLAPSSPFSLFVKETGGPWLNMAMGLGIAFRDPECPDSPDLDGRTSVFDRAGPGLARGGEPGAGDGPQAFRFAMGSDPTGSGYR